MRISESQLKNALSRFDFTFRNINFKVVCPIDNRILLCASTDDPNEIPRSLMAYLDVRNLVFRPFLNKEVHTSTGIEFTYAWLTEKDFYYYVAKIMGRK